jgi:radical SAM protein (TIGR01212 family)
MDAKDRRYRDFNGYMRGIFGCRVQKITVDAGLTCPNRDGRLSTKGCIYCNGRGSGTGAYEKGQSITEQLKNGKRRLSKRYKAHKFMAYFQSYTNTYAPLKKLQALYDEALAISDIVGLSIGTRPDCVDEPILELLEQYAQNHLIWIEYGIQSIHDNTLALINRGHDFSCFKQSVELTKKHRIKVCAHVILGLPSENRAQMIETANAMADLGIDGIKLHLLYVVRDSGLHQMYRAGKYTCLTQKEYVSLVCDFLEKLPSTVVIQRLTGDPHAHELVAPLWAMEKQKTLSMVHETMIMRNSWQGKYVS